LVVTNAWHLHILAKEIASSASVLVAEQQLARESGFSDLLPKPILEEELFQVFSESHRGRLAVRRVVRMQ
jgi:CheY-like chemotaxis protein